MNKKALVTILRKNFPRVRLKKGMTLEQIGLEFSESEGQQSVIDYIERMDDNARLG